MTPEAVEAAAKQVQQLRSAERTLGQVVTAIDEGAQTVAVSTTAGGFYLSPELGIRTLRAVKTETEARIDELKAAIARL